MKNLLLTALVFLGISQIALAQSSVPRNTKMETPTPAPTTTAPESYNSASSDSIDSRPLSKGGFFIEPMILMTQEDTTIKTSQLPIISDDTSGTSKGYGFGLRLGGHVSEVLQLGLDARYVKTAFSDSFYHNADSNAYDIAPTIGLQTPYYGVRLLAGYVIDGESDPQPGVQGLDFKFKDARGWRAGAGLFISSVSLNLEYQDITYDSTQVQSYGSTAINKISYVDANNRGLTLSLSFPVEL